MHTLFTALLRPIKGIWSSLFGPKMPALEGREHKESSASKHYTIYTCQSVNGQWAAKGFPTDDGWVVMAGSTIRSEKLPPSTSTSILRSRMDLITAQLVGSSESGLLTFYQDVEFTSASAAACAVWGSSSNGHTAWVDNNGHTYKKNLHLSYTWNLETN